MARDYAKQKKPRTAKKTKKPATRRNRNREPTIQWGTFGTGMITGILCTLVAAFLPSQFPLQGTNPDSPDDRAGSVKTPVAKKTSYEFFDRLPNDEVPIQEDAYEELRPDVAKTPTEYLLQAGSFRSAEDASRMRANLLLLDLRAYTEQTTISGSVWHRVLVGPFKSKTEYNRALTRLREENLTPLPIRRSA